MKGLRAAAFSILLSCAAVAAPPENADPALHTWFESQTVPSGPLKGSGCCSVADGRPTEYRIEGDHFEAFIGKNNWATAPDAWLPVPQDAILHSSNPTGRAIVWWYGGVIRCFCPPSLT